MHTDEAVVRFGSGGRLRRGHGPRRRATAHRAGVPGPNAGQLPDRRAEPQAARRAVWDPIQAGGSAHAAGARDGRPVGPQGLPGGHVLRRHAAPARDRPRADAFAPRPVPRRADDRPRPPDPALDLDLHPGAQGVRGDHHLHDHPLHGRGRVVRSHRDHGQRRDRGPGRSREAEGAGGNRPRHDPHRGRRCGDRGPPGAVRDRGPHRRGRGEHRRSRW